jgi:hypothetical protein
MALYIQEVKAFIADGGFVMFTHKTCRPVVVMPNGNELRIDKRAYHAFLQHPIGERIEHGSLENDDLVIEWHA